MNYQQKISRFCGPLYFIAGRFHKKIGRIGTILPYRGVGSAPYRGPDSVPYRGQVSVTYNRPFQNNTEFFSKATILPYRRPI